MVYCCVWPHGKDASRSRSQTMQFRVRIGFTEKKRSVGHDEKKDKTATSVQCSVGDEGNAL